MKENIAVYLCVYFFAVSAAAEVSYQNISVQTLFDLDCSHHHRHHHGETKSRHSPKCANYLKSIRKRQIDYYYKPQIQTSYIPSRCYQPSCYYCPRISCRNRCPQYTAPTYQKPTCRCNPKGSEFSTCDAKTGQCRCKPNYEGLTCDKCKFSYWETSNGCVKCNCNITGSVNTACDQRGKCSCKKGVGGDLCDKCLPNFYGFSITGCKECKPCNKPNHICDMNTGECVCPSLTAGEFCHECVKRAWGDASKGSCKPCGCSEKGSSKLECNKLTGKCPCKPNIGGEKCDKCVHGFFGYPKCEKCNCNIAGTDADKTICTNKKCQCNENGICPCKENVIGLKCSTCKENTFGLDIDNKAGCTKCFCFGRSKKCEEAGLTWDQERAKNRTVHQTYSRKIIPDNEKYIISEMPDEVQHPVVNSAPLYWTLPPNFLGDLTTSYGGYLRFKIKTYNSGEISYKFTTLPLVSIYGRKYILHLYDSDKEQYVIKIHESMWRDETKYVTKEKLMVVLQNVTKILIKVTNSVFFDKVTLTDLSLDRAKFITGNPQPIAHSIEKCECPPQYSGYSCQDPKEGFYREFNLPEIPTMSWIDKEIGIAKPCRCNGFSDKCNKETGECQDCRNNTAGIFCQNCKKGYYKNEGISGEECLPCECPSKSNNNAESCSLDNGHFICKCREGK